jgi:formate hydrogenlyase subunit 3/multisubunit Na+/H+ antiporter MnhD subunit
MNTLSNLSFLGLNHILLQNVSSSFQMNLILYLSVAIIVLTIVVLVVVYRALQIVLQASGLKAATGEVLTIDWVKYLYILTIGLVLISLYIYSELT